MICFRNAEWKYISCMVSSKNDIFTGGVSFRLGVLVSHVSLHNSFVPFAVVFLPLSSSTNTNSSLTNVNKDIQLYILEKHEL